MLLIKVWHNYMFIHKLIRSWNLVSVLGWWSMCINVGGKTDVWFIFLSTVSAQFLLWLVPANTTVGLLPVCGLASEPTLSAPRPTHSVSGCKLAQYLLEVTGHGCFTLCFSLPLLVFLSSPISRSLISSSKNNLV